MLLRHVEADEISVAKEENKCQLYNTIILPALLYESDSWTLTRHMKHFLEVLRERF
jgi:hypothetical protein